MKNYAKFNKVTFEQFEKDCDKKNCRQIFDQLKLPCRATKGSAGYDFFAPFDIDIENGKSLTIPTGIFATMPSNWVLLIFPRSGLGFKYRLRLNNTVGVVDSDYCQSQNQGHIFVKISNEGDTPLKISAGTAFAQGIFTVFGLTEDDQAEQTRDGGFGSTDK